MTFLFGIRIPYHGGMDKRVSGWPLHAMYVLFELTYRNITKIMQKYNTRWHCLGLIQDTKRACDLVIQLLAREYQKRNNII